MMKEQASVDGADLYALIDTNVLLHFRPLGELALDRLLNARPVSAVICRQVIHELDREKARGTRRSKDRATRILPEIESWHDQGTVRLSEAVTVRVDVDVGLSREQMGRAGLDPDWGDDHVIAAGLALQGQGKHVVLISDDTGARLRARTHGLLAEGPPEECRLPLEKDETERELQQLRMEVAKLSSTRPQLKVCFADGSGVLRWPRPLGGDPDRLAKMVERVISLELAELDEAEAKRRHDAYALFDAPSRAEFARYEEEKRAYPDKLRRYYEELADQRHLVARSLPVSLFVENTGTAVATDIDIMLGVPDRLKVHEGDEGSHDLPSPPLRPEQPRGTMQYMLDEVASVRLVHDMTAPASFLRSLYGPPAAQIEKATVTYSLERLKHGHRQELAPLLFEFLEEDAVASFNVGYRITLVEVGSAEEGKLHFVLDESAGPDAIDSRS